MLLLNVTERVDVPHEADQWFELRKLSWKQLGDAREVQQRAAFDQARYLGAELVETFTGRQNKEALEEAKKNVESESNDGYQLSSYDLGTLLKEGVAGWSYEGKVKVDALDEFTAKWAGQALLDLVRPDSEEAAKNS